MYKNYKLSVCTVCMNRLYHLKETLLKNIEDNLAYPNLEHVILDYNSGDNMETWAKEYLSEYINSGRVKYYRTPDPQKFNMSHAKNMVSRLADGDIVCLVDADNYTGRGYAEYVNDCFNKRENIFLTTIAKRRIKNKMDVLGRICFWKNDFLQIKGFDEFISSYGFDDHDFANRLTLANRKRILLGKLKYLKAITHSFHERVENQEVGKAFDRLFIHHIYPSESKLLYLFADQSFSLGIIKDNNAAVALSFDRLLADKKNKYDESLTTEDWLRGSWIEEGPVLNLNFNDGNKLTFSSPDTQESMLTCEKGHAYFRVTNKRIILDMILFHTMIRNRNRMCANLKHKKTIVNSGGFGAGRVLANFNDDVFINI